MISDAVQYIDQKQCTRREYAYSARRFDRIVPGISAATLTTAHIEEYRAACLKSGLSRRTIESSISDLITIARHIAGNTVSHGRRLRAKNPIPIPVEISVVAATERKSAPWLQRWIRLTYWTGLRLADGVCCLLELDGEIPKTLSVAASKTEKRHVFPIPDWLCEWWKSSPVPFPRAADFAYKVVRRELYRACEAAGVEPWTPKQLRQRSINEWSRANGMAGSILHGSGLGVMKHYIDPLTVLQAAAPRVRLPEGWCDNRDDAESVLSIYRRLDPEAQLIVGQTVRRMATG